MCRFVIVLAIIACLGIITTEGRSVHKKKKVGKDENCPGCIVHHDPKDPVLMKGLKAAIAVKHLNFKPVRILEAWKQVVAGFKYIVDFEADNGNVCHGSWVDAPWMSKEPIDIKILCATDKKGKKQE